MASSSRKRKRETYTLDGSKLRDAIKKTYFENFDDYFEGLMRGRARHQTSRRKFALYNRQVNKKYLKLRERLYEKDKEGKLIVDEKGKTIVNEEKLKTETEVFERLKKRIEVPCDDEGGLTEDGYGGGQYDFFLYDYFYQNFKENVTIYVVNLTEVYQPELLGDGNIDLVDDDAEPKFGDKKLQPAMFGTTPNPISIIKEVERGPQMKNLFLRLRGDHYEVLKVKEGVTDRQLNDFQGATAEKKVRENWKKYFTVVRPKVKPDGMCYWNAVAKAFNMEEDFEITDLTDEKISALKF